MSLRHGVTILNSPANDTDPGSDSPLVFPCRFPLKAIGYAAANFDALVVSLIRKHAPDIQEGAVTRRYSNGARYLAVTVTVQAESRSQLDAIYRDLTAHPSILMVL